MKRKLAILLAASLAVATLAGCGKTDSTKEPAAEAKSETQEKESDDIYTIKYAYMTTSVPKDVDKVTEKINEYIEDKIGCHFEFCILTGDFETQLNLMMSSGEKLDLVCELGTRLPSDVSKNMLIPLNDLLDEYGQGILETAGEYLPATTINGNIYSVPSLRSMSIATGLTMDKEIADKYGIDINAITSPEQLTPIFEKIKKDRPDQPLVYSTSTQRSIYDNAFTNYDILGDGIGVLAEDGKTVVNKFEMDQYEKDLKLIRDWYQKGYILSDNATNNDVMTLHAQGQLIGGFQLIQPGCDNSMSAFVGGKPLVTIQLTEPLLTTVQVASCATAIPINCENPEKAMQFLNLMYTDPYLINLIDWGIEGEHYVKTDVENVIRYPDGVTTETQGWNYACGFLFGNQLLSYVIEGDSPTLYQELDAWNHSSKASPALGFTFDSSAVKTEYVAVQNVISEYKVALEDGALDVDETLPKFQRALRDAGIDTVIAEKQRQYTEWLNEQEK